MDSESDTETAVGRFEELYQLVETTPEVENLERMLDMDADTEDESDPES